jgi:hypothetical protein
MHLNETQLVLDDSFSCGSGGTAARSIIPDQTFVQAFKYLMMTTIGDNMTGKMSAG